MGHGFTHNSRPHSLLIFPSAFLTFFVKKFHELSLRKTCLAAVETVAVALRANAEVAVEDWFLVKQSESVSRNQSIRCKMYPDMSFSESTTTETLVFGVAPQKAYVSSRSTRDLRWAWQLRMVGASAETTAHATPAPANEKKSQSLYNKNVNVGAV
ncbi:hypothetical protein RJ640_014433 [Escallonia rubra]|uniref:Metallothionein-like protein n=1 Tax=Escallonia rubra TaxID=112253 RepID=A0AA88U6B9_9ASTE|nr:hypothetical protein RJ640_014433 [Escallonia rubra]